MKKRVVIVGAGPSGLVALKEMREAGHDATIVEMKHVIGGVFSSLADSAYDLLYLTTSNVFMAFSDFPCPEDHIKYSAKEEYNAYLMLYAAHFELMPHIHLETAVERATLGSDGKWTISCVSTKASTPHRFEAVDSLIVCTGSNRMAKPVPEKLNRFSGRLLHSSAFRNAAEFKDERVLVVGIGESGADIASEVAAVAKDTCVWSRRPFMLAPRFSPTQFFDPKYDEFEWLTTESRWRNCRVGDYLETLTTSRAMNSLPTWLYGMTRQFGWKMLSTMPGISGGFNYVCRYSLACTNFKGAPKSVYFKADQAAWVTKNARVADLASRRKLEVIVAAEAEFVEQSAVFKNVTQDPVTAFMLQEPIDVTREFDTVICCTGYTNDFKWIETDKYGELGWSPRSWYRHCWPPGFGDKLAFLGWARPHQGGIPQTAELCARFHALLLSGKRQLPADVACITLAESRDEAVFYELSPNLESLVDWPSYSTSLSRMIGCEPAAPWLMWSPITWLKYWLYPMWPCWFRLRGPGAKPEAFYKVMNRFPLKNSGILVDAMTAILVFAIAPAQKCVGNLVTYIVRPFRRAARNHDWTSLIDRSKLNLLHSNDLQLKNVLTWSS